jgi:signal transduction histidine kinase
VITVQDNGKGFDTATVEMSSHGLAGMRHRVESCGGQLTVSSEPGKGTLITAVLPKQPVSGAPLHRAARHAPAACVAKPPASAIGDRFMHTH